MDHLKELPSESWKRADFIYKMIVVVGIYASWATIVLVLWKNLTRPK